MICVLQALTSVSKYKLYIAFWHVTLKMLLREISLFSKKISMQGIANISCLIHSILVIAGVKK